LGVFLQYKLSKEKQVKILQTEQRKASKDPKNRFLKEKTFFGFLQRLALGNTA